MLKQIMSEIEQIIGRRLEPIERLKVRSAATRGMVNPFDIVTALGLK